MAGTVPAGLVLCAFCGRTVKGYKSRMAYNGTDDDYVAYPHRHKDLAGVDCEGRYQRAERSDNGASTGAGKSS